MAMRRPDRARAHQLLVDSERLERELLVLIGRLTAFTDELQVQLQDRRDDNGGGDHGPAADGSPVR